MISAVLIKCSCTCATANPDSNFLLSLSREEGISWRKIPTQWRRGEEGGHAHTFLTTCLLVTPRNLLLIFRQIWNSSKYTNVTFHWNYRTRRREIENPSRPLFRLHVSGNKPLFGLHGTPGKGFVGFNLTHKFLRGRHPQLFCKAWLKANPCLDGSCSKQSSASSWCPKTTAKIHPEYILVLPMRLRQHVTCFQPTFMKSNWGKFCSFSNSNKIFELKVVTTNLNKGRFDQGKAPIAAL